ESSCRKWQRSIPYLWCNVAQTGHEFSRMNQDQGEREESACKPHGTCVFDPGQEVFRNLLHSAAAFSTVGAQEKNNSRKRAAGSVVISRSQLAVLSSRRVRVRISVTFVVRIS